MAKVPVRRHLRRRGAEPRIARLDKKFGDYEHGGRPEKLETKAGPIYVRYIGGGGGGIGHKGALVTEEYIVGADALRENAMDNLDDLLGFGVVPPVYIRHGEYVVKGKHEAVTIQAAVPNAMRLGDYIYKAELVVSKKNRYPANIPPEQFIREVAQELFKQLYKDDFIKIAILDYIGVNLDRHGANAIINRNTGHLFAIDHELTFEPYGDESVARVYSLPWLYTQGEKFPLAIRRGLENVTEEDFRAALAGLRDDTISSAWQRKMTLQRLGRMPAYKTVNETVEMAKVGRLNA